MQNGCLFNGWLDSKCKEICVPLSIKAMATMVLQGPNIENIRTQHLSKINISQLAIFNTTKESPTFKLFPQLEENHH